MMHNANGYMNANFSELRGFQSNISSISYVATLVLARWAGVVDTLRRLIQRLKGGKRTENFESFTLM